MARNPSRDRPRGHKNKPTSALPPARTLESTPERAAAWVIVALLVVTPLIVFTDLKEGFRLPQNLAGGWLGLASLLVASFMMRDVASVPMQPAEWWRRQPESFFQIGENDQRRDDEQRDDHPRSRTLRRRFRRACRR